MPAWSPGFLDRIKQNIAPALSRTLAPTVQGPGQGDNDAPEENVNPSFLDRIKEKARDIPLIQRQLLDPKAQITPELIKYRIRYAGSNNTLLLMRYNNTWRHVEPYSYRWRGKADGSGKRKLLFFGFCRAHNEIHGFRLDKIQGLLTTDETFAPRWPIELA